MGIPFKMKGSPMQRNFGIGSPLHETTWEKVKKVGKKAVKAVGKAALGVAGTTYDKASQIGEGAKGFVKEAVRDTRYGGIKDPFTAAGNAYRREKASDEGKKAPKDKPKQHSGGY